jgi:hypothetical protein
MARSRAKKKQNEYVCRACNTDFGSPIGLSKHYKNVSDSHLARALVKRYGHIPKEKWRRKSPPPSTKNGKILAPTASAVPMKTRSSRPLRPILRYCTSCGTRKGTGWTYCGKCGAKIAARR